MDDFISREDTIEKMEGVDWYHQNKNGEMVHGANSSEHQAWYKAEDVYKVLEDMPPAQPEREKGHWIPYDQRFPWSNDYKCSECGNYLNFSGVNGGRGDANFCPNCGSDMRGEQDE